MKQKYRLAFIFIVISFTLFTNNVNAQRGCCSWHGGVAGCSSNGRQICNDGTLSPSCICTPINSYIYGCTSSSAINYNSKANKDNGTCRYYIYGCTDKNATNYNSNANTNDDSCKYLNNEVVNSGNDDAIDNEPSNNAVWIELALFVGFIISTKYMFKNTRGEKKP